MPKAKKAKVFARPEHFITTVPVIRPCRRCQWWVAAGISEGIHVVVDLTALDAEQTILAMLVKLRVFCLTRTGLVELDTYRLRDPRFASRLPQHRCDMRWPVKVIGAGPVAPPTNSDIPPY